MMVKKLMCLLLVAWTGFVCHAQTEMPLYEDVIPNSKATGIREEKKFDPQVGDLVIQVVSPTLTMFAPPPEMRNGSAVIICPGGGYHCLLINREGSDVAKAFNKAGVTAFVLKYRLPNAAIFEDRSTGPLQDAQRAIQLVRENAGKYQVNPDKIGIMGFSAGGHLAASAGVHFNDEWISNPQKINLRPDFMILIYPVISFSDKTGHQGSRDNLLGRSATPAQIRYFSCEEHVNPSTPMTFLTHAGDDTVVSPENSLIFFEKLSDQGVPAKLHLFSAGEHGYLIEPSFEEWFADCLSWMKRNGLAGKN
ncbi:MAG: alpha/beta hydrolase [Mangrovibacterium sp.]|nr:alpha/beta hydrolase [Mangrovibacterium sp.]